MDFLTLVFVAAEMKTCEIEATERETRLQMGIGCTNHSRQAPHTDSVEWVAEKKEEEAKCQSFTSMSRSSPPPRHQCRKEEEFRPTFSGTHFLLSVVTLRFFSLGEVMACISQQHITVCLHGI